MMRFDGKVAVVTGGAKGIGGAVSALLAERGAKVGILDNDAEGANAHADALNSVGAQVAAQAVDVSDTQQVEAAVSALAKELGAVDILVCSAGIQRYGDALTTPREQWDEVMGVNLIGSWNAARACLPMMRKSGAGAIVNVASVQSVATQAGVFAYTVSKHALIGLTRSMAMDFAADGIRVNAVCPGTVDTPMLKWAASLAPEPGAVYDMCARMHPVGRIAQPREIAEVCAFLAHESASFVTAAVWLVDGGLLTRIGGAPQEAKAPAK